MFAASAICGATADVSMEGKFLEISNEKQLVCPRGPGEIVLLLLQQPFSKYVSISHPFCEMFLCRGISAFCDRRSPHSVFFYPLSSCKGFWVIPPFFQQQQQQQLPHVFQMRAPPDDFVGDFAIMKASFVLEGKCDKPMRAYVHTHMSHRRAKCTHRKP